MEQNEILWSILCKSFEIVADLQLHSLLLHSGCLEDPQTHGLQANPAEEEIIGYLDNQSTMHALDLHEIVQKKLDDSGLSQGKMDLMRNFLVFTRSSSQDGQNKQRNSIVGIVSVIAERQHQLRVAVEIRYRAQVEFERFLEGLKCVFQVEVGPLSDDPSHTVLQHLSSAESNLREGIDEPRPLVIIADFPLYLIEDLSSEEAVDDQVAEMPNSHSHILIDHFHKKLQIILLVLRRRNCYDFCQKCLIC